MNKKVLEELSKDLVMSNRAYAVKDLLLTIAGEDANRPGLQETPWRVAKMFGEIYNGYGKDAIGILNDAKFEDIPSDDIVLLSNIPFYSTCEHHMMPFFGKIDIAYIPSEGNVVGLSKLARVVEVYARRLQVQERLGQQIAEAIQTALNPKAVAVMINAEHTCMTARGVKSLGSKTQTACLRGEFMTDAEARNELYNLASLTK